MVYNSGTSVLKWRVGNDDNDDFKTILKLFLSILISLTMYFV